MPDTSLLASSLLARETEPGPIADLLWSRAGTDVGAVSVPPTSALALKLVKSSWDLATRIIPLLTDSDVLAQIARTDTRKKVLRLVARKEATSHATLIVLLDKAFGPKFQDSELASIILSRSEITWPDLHAALVRAGTENVTFDRYDWRNLASKALAGTAQDGTDQDWIRQALALDLFDLTNGLLDRVLARESALTVGEVLNLVAGSDLGRRQSLLTRALNDSSSPSLELAREVVAALPGWDPFPTLYRNTPWLLEVIELFAAVQDPRLDALLVDVPNLPEDILDRLSRIPALQARIAVRSNLPEKIIDRIAEAPVVARATGPSLYFSGSLGPCAARNLMSNRSLGNLSQRTAERLVERVVAGEFRAEPAVMFPILARCSPASLVSYLQSANWNITQEYLRGRHCAPVQEVISALFEQPGQAFSTMSSTYGRNPQVDDAPATRAEISERVLADITDSIGGTPWIGLVLDECVGVLKYWENRHVRRYAEDQIEQFTSVEEVETFLALAFEWEGTLAELIDTVKTVSSPS